MYQFLNLPARSNIKSALEFSSSDSLKCNTCRCPVISRVHRLMIVISSISMSPTLQEPQGVPRNSPKKQLDFDIFSSCFGLPVIPRQRGKQNKHKSRGQNRSNSTFAILATTSKATLNWLLRFSAVNVIKLKREFRCLGVKVFVEQKVLISGQSL